jgi:hypothetical protein
LLSTSPTARLGGRDTLATSSRRGRAARSRPGTLDATVLADEAGVPGDIPGNILEALIRELRRAKGLKTNAEIR